MPPQFDHEKLDVYKVELSFIRWVTPLLRKIKNAVDSETTEVRQQLDRASLSMLLNTAEGNGKRLGRSRFKFFDDARGSAMECAGCLDALVAKGAVSEGEILDGKELLLRVVQMLSKMIHPSEQSPRVSEKENEYEADRDKGDN